MNKIIRHINKLPKPESPINFRPIRTKKFEWYYNFLFVLFLLFGVNVFMNPKIFRIGLMIKLVWIMVLGNVFYTQQLNLAESFILYGFLFTYLFHFYDIFMIFFFAIFVPNGNRLLEE